jgi:hypothetical protein
MRRVTDGFRFSASAVLPVIVLAVAASSASACSVPVFRYALEHWPADPYVAIVFHRGELTPEQQTVVEQLDSKDESGAPIANLVVRTVDLDTETSEVILNLWKEHETQTLPLLSLQTPPRQGPPRTVWVGELTPGNVSGLLNSPVRQRVNERLLEGESVVWLLLESGEKEADDAAFALLERELERLEQVITPPAIEEEDLASLSVAPDALKIRFSAYRVSRDDEKERSLVEMLLRVEPDLLEEPYVHQTMAFPIFGRGRALYSLVGEGITAETIEDASRFLSGACQCTVKAENPGVDLLMAVNWDAHVQPALPYDDSQPVLAGLGGFVAPDEDEGPIEDPAATEIAEAGTNHAAAEESVERDSPASRSIAGASAEDAPLLLTDGSVPDVDLTQASHETAAGENVQLLAQNITVLLGLMVAAVVVISLVVLMKSR